LWNPVLRRVFRFGIAVWLTKNDEPALSDIAEGFRASRCGAPRGRFPCD
jgi:hypothetical protein